MSARRRVADSGSSARLTSSDHVIVVGAGLAGWRLVQALRRENYDGAISLVGAEPHLPYDRPPLSKQVLRGRWTSDATGLANEEDVARERVTLHLGVAAVDLDVADTTVHLADGSALAGTHVALATGVRARRLALTSRRVHTLRTRDDASLLVARLDELAPASQVAIIGGGFIGAEVASAVAVRGHVPIVLEAAARPLIAVLGPQVSAWLEPLPSRVGATLLTEQRIVDVVDDDEDTLRVVFDHGGDLAVRAVVVGVGAVPNDDWLATSGLVIDNGVVVDRHLTAVPGVAALGDVARFSWDGPLGEELVRVEHWQVANDHATRLAHWWASGEEVTTPLVPYFWSDQYGTKIQVLGHPRPDDEVRRVAGDDERWLALYAHEGVVSGVVALAQPRALMLSRGLLERPTTLEEARRLEPWAH